MKTYLFVPLLFSMLTIYACERSIINSPPKVCDYNNYWLMEKPREQNPCELEYWEDQQFKEKKIGYITFDDIDDDE